MNAAGPLFKVLRVAAIMLSLGMLVWFVYRSAGSHSYRSAGSRSTNLAATVDGSPTNAATPGLEVAAKVIASSSKSIDAVIVATSGSQDAQEQTSGTVSIGGRSFRTQNSSETPTPTPEPSGTPAGEGSFSIPGGSDAPVLAPSSKSISQPIFSVREYPSPSPEGGDPQPSGKNGSPGKKPVLAPSPKSAPIFYDEPEATPAPAPTPASSPSMTLASPTPFSLKGSDGMLIAPSSKSGMIFRPPATPAPAATPAAPSPTP